jgi:hypothetical protein
MFKFHVWLVAFTATLYNKKFSGYHPCQLVKRRKPDVSRTISVLVFRVLMYLIHDGEHHHECGTRACQYDMDWFSRYISTLKMGTEMVLETSDFMPFTQLTRLVTRGFFLLFKFLLSKNVFKRSYTFRFYVSSLIIISVKLTKPVYKLYINDSLPDLHVPLTVWDSRLRLYPQ